MLISNLRTAVAGCAIAMLSTTAALAGTITFSGQLDAILEDNGGVYSGVPLGTTFSGTIDDATAFGSISDGTTNTDFTCCAAAGGLDSFAESNDQVVSTDAATLINSLQSVRTFAAGDLVDIVNLEGDVILANGNRLEAGLSFVFDASTFTDPNAPIYPFDSADLLFTLFFILEENTATGQDVYSGLGLVDVLELPPVDPGPPIAPIPVPAGLPMMIGGLLTLGLLSRRSRARS